MLVDGLCVEQGIGDQQQRLLRGTDEYHASRHAKNLNAGKLPQKMLLDDSSSASTWLMRTGCPYAGKGVPCLRLLRQEFHADRLILHIAGITGSSRPTLIVTSLTGQTRTYSSSTAVRQQLSKLALQCLEAHVGHAVGGPCQRRNPVSTRMKKWFESAQQPGSPAGVFHRPSTKYW